MFSPELAHTRQPAPRTPPDGYVEDENVPGLWWGSKKVAPAFTVEASWSEEEGHRVLIEAGDALTPIQVGALCQSLLTFQRLAWANL